MHDPCRLAYVVSSLALQCVGSVTADELDGLENSHFLHGTRTQGPQGSAGGRSHLQDVDELRSALAYIFPEQTEQELQDFIDRVCVQQSQTHSRTHCGHGLARPSLPPRHANAPHVEYPKYSAAALGMHAQLSTTVVCNTPAALFRCLCRVRRVRYVVCRSDRHGRRRRGRRGRVCRGNHLRGHVSQAGEL